MRYSFRSLAAPLAVFSIALAAPSAASAQMMTFTTGVACTSGPTTHSTYDDVGSPYSEAGFTLFTPGANAFITWCSNSANFAGPGLVINTPGSDATLTKSGGGTFSINKIDLAHAFAGVVAPQSFTFTGTLLGGGTVSQTFTIGAQDGRPTFTSFLFDPTWTNLTSVMFASQTGSFYQFSNVLLNATTVPEPASMALLGTGLVGLFGAVRRRRNESA
jgi:PEP-CTERM motif